MITLEEAYRLIDSVVANATLPVETIAVNEGLDRVIAEQQCSKLDLPAFNKSAMDGYAILAGDQQREYLLLETVAAGCMPQQQLNVGTAIKVMTGAPVPKGAGQVIPVEKAIESGEIVQIIAAENMRHICEQGEDVRCGDVVMNAATILRPIEIANLISCGITTINVLKQPRVAIFSTGNEIVESIDCITPGKIMNSNGPMLCALCNKYGYQIEIYQTLADDLPSTTKALAKALEQVDVVIFSGGVSMGEFDYVAQAINDVGLKIYFDRVAVKPGKPTTFAAKDNKFIFGLPGNPVAVYLTFHLFVRHALKLLLGIYPQENLMKFPLQRQYKRQKVERAEFVPCCFVEDVKLAPVTFHGSAHLLALTQADGFFLVPKGVQHIEENQQVRFFRI